MITNRILTLKMVDGLPAVPGDVFVSEETGGHYIAYSRQVTKGTNTKGTHLPLAFVNVLGVKGDDALCAVFAEANVFATIDPTNAGVPMTSYKLDADKVKDWPVWHCVGTLKGEPWRGTLRVATPVGALPWTIGDITVTQAKPAVPSTIAGVDMQDNLDSIVSLG